MENASPDSKAHGQAPKFSIIMPVYNHAQYVDEAIRSVRNQTRSDWELIVVDDGSTDESPAIAESHAKEDIRISVLRRSNAGPAAARNAAARRGRADWLVFLDSDDIWYPNTLELYARAIDEHPEARFVYGYRDRLNPDGTVTKLTGEFQESPGGTTELFQRMFLHPMASCLSKVMFEQSGEFNETLRSCEDYDLFLRITLLTKLQPFGKSTGLRRRHERNISRRSGFSRFQEAEVLRRFVGREGAREAVPTGIIAGRLGRIYCSSGGEYFKSRCFRAGLVALTQSLHFRPTIRAFLLKALCTLLLPLTREDNREIPWLTDPPDRPG